jgi:hypothetical protein
MAMRVLPEASLWLPFPAEAVDIDERPERQKIAGKRFAVDDY